MRYIVFLLLLLPSLLWGQYPNNPRKQRLGYQTTGAGLVYIKSGAPAHTPSTDEDAWMVLDTTNNALYYWDETAGDWENFLDDFTRDTVFRITNVPDTALLVPLQGDVFINAAGDTMGVYAAHWELFFGGAGLTGSGTTGNLARWDSSSSLTDADITDNGSVINIGASRDEVTVEATDSVLVDGPVVNIGGQPSATVRVSDTDETVTVQAGALEQKIVVDDFGLNVQVDGGSYYMATGSPPVDGKNHVQAWFNGSAQWLNLTDSLAAGGGGDNLGDHTATTDLDMDGNNIQLAGGYVIGGTGTGSDLVFQTTTGSGDVGSDVIFLNGNNGGDEAMRIKGDGDVGIGTSSPFQTLHVQGTARITGSDGTGTRLMLRDADGDISDATLGAGLTLTTGTLAANDTVTTLLQDSILVYSVAGVETGRDTISVAGTGGGGGVSGSGTTNRTALWTAATTLGDSYLLQSASALTLDANKMVVHVGGTPASRPAATSGGHWFNTTTLRPQWSDGVNWNSFVSTALSAGKFTSGSIPISDAGGNLTEAANFFYNTANGSFNLGGTGGTEVFNIFSDIGEGWALYREGTTDLYSNFSLNDGSNTGCVFWMAGPSLSEDIYLRTDGTNPHSYIKGGLRIGSSLTRFSGIGKGLSLGSTALDDIIGISLDIPGSTGLTAGGIKFRLEFGAYTKTSAEITTETTNNFGRADLLFKTGDFADLTSSAVERMRITRQGYVGIGTTTPTAKLHLPAGTATASTAPLKFTEGTNLTTPEAGAAEWDGSRLYLSQTSGPTRKAVAYTTDIGVLAAQNASYYEEAVRQYTLGSGADSIITVDTMTLAIKTDSISASAGLIENLKADTVRWQVRYDFYYLSDEDACFALLDLTTDGTETPAAIPGSAARGEQVSLNGGQMPGRTCLVDVPPGQKIRLCVKGNVGVATSMDISFLTITINEINRE